MANIVSAVNMMAHIQDPALLIETKKELVDTYAASVGMNKTNADGLLVLAEKGPSGMFAHMLEQSGGDMSRMYH